MSDPQQTPRLARCLVCRMQTELRFLRLSMCPICRDPSYDFFLASGVQLLMAPIMGISVGQFMLEEVLLPLCAGRHQAPRQGTMGARVMAVRALAVNPEAACSAAGTRGGGVCGRSPCIVRHRVSCPRWLAPERIPGAILPRSVTFSSGARLATPLPSVTLSRRATYA